MSIAKVLGYDIAVESKRNFGSKFTLKMRFMGRATNVDKKVIIDTKLAS